MPRVPPRLPKLKPISPEVEALAGLWTWAIDLAAAAMLLVIAVDAWAPPPDLPWKPLRLDQPVGLATAAKFARAADDPGLCRQVLADGGVNILEEPARSISVRKLSVVKCETCS